MGTHNAETTKFQCPDGFILEDVAESQLKHEEIDEDDELWLIRMPSVLEPSNFEDSVISLNGDSNRLKHKGDNRRRYQCTAVPCETDQLCLILPKKKNNKLKAVKKSFSGTIFFTDEAPTPNAVGFSDLDSCESISQDINTSDSYNAQPSSFSKKKKRKHAEKPVSLNSLSDIELSSIKTEKPSEIEDNVIDSQQSEASGSEKKSLHKKKKKHSKKLHQNKGMETYSTEIDDFTDFL